jgi:hypothetical protein
MKKMEGTYHFTAVLEKFNSNLWGHHLSVPDTVAQVFVANDAKRIVCTLNEAVEFQAALMPKGDGAWFININKTLRDKLGLMIGTPVRVALRKDDSEYGLPMPEEFAELLHQDEVGNQIFHALTPGKQRTLLYIVGSVKSPDLRLNRAIVVVEHLKENSGKINFKQLYAQLKNPER